jgi:bleomycin hydrolase
MRLLTIPLRRLRFVYQVVIPKKLAESKYVKILEENRARVLPAWDPMGTLA